MVHKQKEKASKRSTLGSLTSDSGYNILRCGRWKLRATKIRKQRGQIKDCCPSVTSPINKRKEPASPISSTSSSVGDNDKSGNMASEDYGMWPSNVTLAFINIMLDEAKREGGAVSRKGRTFTPQQWNEFNNEMIMRVGRGYGASKLKQKFSRLSTQWREFHDLVCHTGLGWCHERKTVTGPADLWDTYVKAHPSAAKFLNKGLENYELLTELLTGKFAHGAFARGSTEGAPDSDEERELERRMDGLQMHGRKEAGEGSGRKKRKSESSDGGGSNKSSKHENALDALTSCSRAREAYFNAQTTTFTSPQNDPVKDSIMECISILDNMEGLDQNDYVQACRKIQTSPEWRTLFLALKPERRFLWVLDAANN